jgi:polyisoprenoid-binding protein YceI
MVRFCATVPFRRALVAVVFACVCGFAPAIQAQQIAVDLDPNGSTVNFTLGATMHTVHGTFKLKNGHIVIDPATGKASGSIVVDATSAQTENSSRDAKMHGEILESKKFPEIVFTPATVKGPLADMLNRQKPAQFEVAGFFSLHGQNHDATLNIAVQPGAAGRVDTTSEFPVPFVSWGLKNPSTFMLHVADTVNVDVHAAGRISAAP